MITTRCRKPKSSHMAQSANAKAIQQKRHKTTKNNLLGTD